MDDGTLATDTSWQMVRFNAVNALQVKFQVVEANSTNTTKFGAAAEVRFTTPAAEDPDNTEDLTVSLSISSGLGGVKMEGRVDDFVDLPVGSQILSHGIVYIPTANLGSDTLTKDTAGCNRVFFNAFTEDGSFTYYLLPTGTTVGYTIRAFAVYRTSDDQEPVTVYSRAVSVNGH